MASQKRAETRKAQILEAAEMVFSQKGFAAATISDVAREAGVSDATIYEYFPSKEELLFSIPGETTRRGNEILRFHLNYIRGAAAKLRSIIYHYLYFYQNNPNYAALVVLVLKPNRKFLETEAYRIVREGYGLILDVIKEGTASGEFKENLNPFLVRAMIIGTIEHLVSRWVLLAKPEDLTDFTDPLTDLIIEGLQKGGSAGSWDLKITLEPGGGAVTGNENPNGR